MQASHYGLPFWWHSTVLVNLVVPLAIGFYTLASTVINYQTNLYDPLWLNAQNTT